MADPVKEFAATGVHLLAAYRRNAGDLRRAYASLLRHLCRELEDFAPRNVSERAHEEGRRRGLDDLRSYHWDQQPRFDEGRTVFHWEHLVPVDVLFRALVDLTAVRSEEVESILRKARIAWILKVEDMALTDRGYRHDRPDPWRAYEDVGIRLLYRACGICLRNGGDYECSDHGDTWGVV